MRTLMQYTLFAKYQPLEGNVYDILGSGIIVIAVCFVPLVQLYQMRSDSGYNLNAENSKELTPLTSTLNDK